MRVVLGLKDYALQHILHQSKSLKNNISKFINPHLINRFYYVVYFFVSYHWTRCWIFPTSFAKEIFFSAQGVQRQSSRNRNTIWQEYLHYCSQVKRKYNISTRIENLETCRKTQNILQTTGIDAPERSMRNSWPWRIYTNKHIYVNRCGYKIQSKTDTETQQSYGKE